MKLVHFPEANSNLMPPLDLGSFFNEQGLIPAFHDATQPIITLKFQMSREELQKLVENDGVFYLSFAHSKDITTIKPEIFPDIIPNPHHIPEQRQEM